MPRIPYQPQDITEPEDLVTAIRARRGGTLLNIDRMLLHSPALTRGWNAFFSQIRNELDLPPKLRELAMSGVAILNQAEYEFRYHGPAFVQAGGTTAQMEGLRHFEAAAENAATFW